MTKFIRSTLATFCFMASVGCLWLWEFSTSRTETWDGAQLHLASMTLNISSVEGIGCLQLVTSGKTHLIQKLLSYRMDESSLAHYKKLIDQQGRFGWAGGGVYFPIWFASLVSAIAGVSVLKIGCFTIRSVLVGVTVVAGLLTMVVVL